MNNQVLILGIGNVLWADEGFGVRCIEILDRNWSFPERVKLLDGGTQGLYLLPFIEESDVLLIFDAIDYGLEPGALKVVEGKEVPSFMGARKLSLHQTGFQEVIATAQFIGRCPNHLILVGCQPEELDDYGGGLRDVVAAQIPLAIDIALEKLRVYGVFPEKEFSNRQLLTSSPISRDTYEGERPSTKDACRIGDPRFFPLTE
ncbi:MAG: HyaD/HybD family hydrogenase maturation endopeptidase [Hyphomicrobiaceae bacterium]|nr:HyaD/HybD family hydrogenase maturation endopeptidase [Hyphomicrobiaceae bacterium]